MLLRLCFLFALLALGCSNPNERDNPTDPIHVYKVTFNTGEATGGTPPADMSGSYGDIIQLPNLEERSGYAFYGWSTDNSGTGDRYKNSYTVTGNTTLHAIWISCSEAGFYCDARDGQAYRTTTIGTQVWMAENLNYNASGSKCYGEGEEVRDSLGNYIMLSESKVKAYCNTYGRLYYWKTAMNNSSASDAVPSGVRGVCPVGWHLPSREEWEVMTAYIGGENTEGKKLKATSGWKSNGNINNGNGTDDYGFSALPGGSYTGSSFNGVGYDGYWWTTNEFITGEYSYYPRATYYKWISVGNSTNWGSSLTRYYDTSKDNWEFHYYDDDLFSVRCVRD